MDERKENTGRSSPFEAEAGVDIYAKYETDHPSRGSSPGENKNIPASLRQLTKEELDDFECKLRRKIDLRLMPAIVLMYLMNYLDRNNIAVARLAGLEKDLNLVNNQYQTSVSILFVGYILMQVPSNLFLNKIGKPSLYLPTCMIVWGTISAATGGTQNFGGLLASRFLLGFVEAAYFPGCLFFLSSWYTRKELAFRTAVLFSGALISGAFSGLIAAGITSGMDNKANLPAWRWLFIIEGVTTVLIATAAYWVLPDLPKTTYWLSEIEKDLAAWRLEKDIGEKDWEGSKHEMLWLGLKLALTDPKTYMLMMLSFCILSSASIANFFPTIVQTLGYSPIASLLLTCPPYLLCVITTFANAVHADKTGERYFHITLPLWVAIASFILAACTTAHGLRYLAMMLMIPSVYTSTAICLAWISNTLPRPPAKRAAAIGAINAVSNSAQIYASYMYPKGAGPRYQAAMGANAAAAALAIIMATVLSRYLKKLNKKLDRGEPIRDVLQKEIQHDRGGSRSRFRFLT